MRDAGTLSEIHTKTDQHCRAEDCLAIDMEYDLVQEFIDKAIPLFQKRLRSYFAAADGHFRQSV